jgi:integrase
MPRHAIWKKRLSELSVRKAKAKPAAYVMWDTKQHGLALRTQPTGAKSWYCVYSRQGRPRWYRLGNADAIGLDDARVLAAEAMLAVARGKDPAAEKRAERSKGTFEELATRYVEEHAKKVNKSWRQGDALVRRHAVPRQGDALVRRHAVPRWGKLQANSITRSDVKALMVSIAAPIVGNQTLAAVSAIFSWGVKEELVAGNPCKLVDRNATRSRERILADSEIPQFWSAFDDGGLVAGSALRVILLSGQRPGEVAHMRHEHIKDGWWTLPGAPEPATKWPGTKNGESHRVWLPTPVRALVAEMGESATGFVFGRAVTKLDVAMRSICAKLGAERATPHDLRRTFSTTVTGLGFGRDALNRVTNHKEGGISDIYDRHHYESENKHIMESVAARIMALVEGRTNNKVVPIRQR